MAILETINNCNDVKKLNINELKTLASEIRELIIETTKTNGGHLASNLGTVDLIVALFYVFDFEKDKMIFDVGHQSYAYKILTDRFKNFSSLRSEDGISGFPDGFESKYDAFTTGHAGTSISASLGYCFSRDYLGEDYYVVNLVGDASFFNGENLEAITYSDKKPNKFLCIFNDNGMSIDKNRNAVYKFVSKVTISKRYNSFNNFLGNLIGRTWLGKLLMRFKLFIKRSLSLYTILDNVGVKYVGVFDGHDIKTLIKILKNIKDSSNATLLHLKTKKGKGYNEAE
ncbi:MAG: 1-deoxy-D-xylulose-5-phosphate synthase, partial [Clostridia bacterium]|nr:1-deoxy-D-xylulose-5-phosphate synthase [Clostridia bacterium]